MRHTATVATLAIALLALPGCSFVRGDAGVYALPPDQRPLEVPPELEVAGTTTPVADGTQSALRSQTGAQRTAAPVASASRFSVAAPREQVFARVGEALEAVEGLEIASRAQLLGAYDVSYQGSNFLVRVTETGAGSDVSAVDPRGVAADSAAATALMAQLKAALGGN